jgi:hypothetical protein
MAQLVISSTENQNQPQNNMNWKTTLLGVATILAAIGTAGKTYLGTGTIPDLGILIASISAGIGLIAAKDAK